MLYAVHSVTIADIQNHVLENLCWDSYSLSYKQQLGTAAVVKILII